RLGSGTRDTASPPPRLRGQCYGIGKFNLEQLIAICPLVFVKRNVRQPHTTQDRVRQVAPLGIAEPFSKNGVSLILAMKEEHTPSLTQRKRASKRLAAWSGAVVGVDDRTGRNGQQHETDPEGPERWRAPYAVAFEGPRIV